MKRTLLLCVCALFSAGPALAAVATAPQPAADASAAANEVSASAEAFLQQADQAARQGNTLAAVQLYQSAIIFAPTDPAGYDRLAQFYATTNQPDMAEKYFGIALDVDPANPPALKGLALLDLAAGDVAGAKKQRDLLVRACGVACPETAQVEKALNAGASGAPN